MRLLIVPAVWLASGAMLTWVLGDTLSLPSSFDEVVAWLRGHGAYAWAVAAAVIVADAFLPVPSTPALASLGIIYGWLAGGLVASGALMVAGLLGFGTTRALGQRGARLLIGEADLARTIADLAGSENITPTHLAEALQYRPRRDMGL